MSAERKTSRVGPSSIATLVIFALVTVTTLVLAGFGVVNYRSQAKTYRQALRLRVKADAGQVAAALALPLWNFDRQQMSRVVESMLKESALVAVRLKEATPRDRVTAWVRADDGAVSQTNIDFPTNGLFREVRAVKASPDNTLGTVELFATTEYLKAQLRQELALTIVRIVVVDVVLSLALYLVLCRWVINPLKAVQKFAVAVSSGSAKDRDLGSAKFIGELELLRGAIEKTVGELELRYTEKEKAELALRRQAAFDELIARVMAQYVRATGEEIDDQVIAGLNEISQFVGVESAVIIQVAPDRGTWSVTHEWCAPNVGSRMGKFQNVPMGGSPWVEDQLVADQPVAIGSRKEMPPHATEERRRWDIAGIQSILHVPLRTR
ncbi:MAG: multi-sensor hybrid histidine kinase, partial [Verrucomicrobiales bacterium]|nr:multi-sensor hybrid histidine kinase [Verrucomicrobiales bacterium]